jgi:hypothetical protein
MIIQVTIGEQLEPTLTRVANQNGVTPEKYVREMVRTFLRGQKRAEIINKIQTKSLEELINLNI